MNAPRPRPGGGFNQGLGQFNDDNLEEADMHQAMKQQALSQQAGAQTGPMQSGNSRSGGMPGSSASPVPSALPPGMGGDPTQSPPTEEPSGDSFVDTILTKPIQDIATTVAEALGLEKLLGLISGPDTPEEKAKKQRTLQRYNQLNEEQQAVVRAKYQERLQREQQMQAEAEQKRQIEEQNNQSFEVPTGPHHGAQEDGNSSKQRAVTKLQQDRKTLGGPQSVG